MEFNSIDYHFNNCQWSLGPPPVDVCRSPYITKTISTDYVCRINNGLSVS